MRLLICAIFLLASSLQHYPNLNTKQDVCLPDPNPSNTVFPFKYKLSDGLYWPNRMNIYRMYEALIVFTELYYTENGGENGFRMYSVHTKVDSQSQISRQDFYEGISLSKEEYIGTLINDFRYSLSMEYSKVDDTCKTTRFIETVRNID